MTEPADYKVDVPEGTSGRWTVERFTVSKKESDFDRMIAIVGSGRGRFVPPGSYTSLKRGDHMIMSDTPDEIRDHRGFIYSATGRVLIAGLGLGVVLQAVARKPEVTHVTVIEKSPDVIKLVEAHWRTKPWGKKFEVVEADIFDWKLPRGVTYDHLWIDIWDDLCLDNLAEMGKLSRKFARAIPNRSSWGHGFLKAEQRRSRGSYW